MKPPHAASAALAAAGVGAIHGVIQALRLRLWCSQGWGADELAAPVAVEAILAALVALLATGLAVAVASRRGGRGVRAAALAGVAVCLALTAAGAVEGPARSVGRGPAARAPTGPRTIVLITADTLRRDHVSAYPDAVLQGGTPNIDALAADGVRFDGAVAPAPLTLPSHTSLLSGRVVPDHGVGRNGRTLPPDLEGAPDRLARVGYRTAAFVSTSVLHGAHGLSRWFSAYRDDLGAHAARSRLPLSGLLFGDPPQTGLQKEPGDRTVDRALSWVGRHPGEPLFVWVHLYDAHAPHADHPAQPTVAPTWDRLPDPCDYVGHPGVRVFSSPTRIITGQEPLFAADRCRARDWKALAARTRTYAAEVAFLDAQVGRLAQGLRDFGRWDDAAVIFVADHGESLTEHQQFVSHQYSLYDPVLRVPLIVRPPGGRPGGATVGGVVGTVTVAATLAAMGGATVDGFEGPDLLAMAAGASASGTAVSVGPLAQAPDPDGQPVRDQIAVRSETRKVISLGGGRWERYDLAADAGERRPLRVDGDEALPGPRAAQASRPRPPARGLPGLPTPRELLAHARAARQNELGDPAVWGLLSATEAPAYAPLEGAATRWRAALDASGGARVDAPAPDLPPAVRDALEALGYVD